METELTSTPNFVAEVIKNGGKKVLVLDCHYPEDEFGKKRRTRMTLLHQGSELSVYCRV